MAENGADYILTRKKLLDYMELYASEPEDRLDPRFAPLRNTDFSGLPPMLIQVGEIEMLRSDGECAAQKVQQCGGQATAQCYAGMFHVFQMGLSQIPESATAWEEVQKFLEGMRAESDE